MHTVCTLYAHNAQMFLHVPALYRAYAEGEHGGGVLISGEGGTHFGGRGTHFGGGRGTHVGRGGGTHFGGGVLIRGEGVLISGKGILISGLTYIWVLISGRMEVKL